MEWESRLHCSLGARRQGKRRRRRTAPARVGPVRALRTADVPVLITVWLLCVATDWSTGVKIALNVTAVALLCAKEVYLHVQLTRQGKRPVRGRRSADRGQLVSAA